VIRAAAVIKEATMISWEAPRQPTCPFQGHCFGLLPGLGEARVHVISSFGWQAIPMFEHPIRLQTRHPSVHSAQVSS
jgi:hypothetical protein